MRIEKLAEIIEKKSPLCIQDPWDNSGFQIKFEAAPVNRVLTAMEDHQSGHRRSRKLES